MDDLSMALAASGGISETEYFVIDNDLRSISIPSSMKIAGVENDDDINRIPFRMPRYVKDTDLSEFQIRINYTNALGEGDLYMVTDKTVEEDTIIFSWLLDRHAFASKGEITFTVCARLIVDGSLVDKEYNTTIHKLTVLQGLETDKAIPVDVQDHFLDWLQEEADRQLTAIQSKGTEVLASIPADYTELSGEVVDLKSAFSSLDEELEAVGDAISESEEHGTSFTFYKNGITDILLNGPATGMYDGYALIDGVNVKVTDTNGQSTNYNAFFLDNQVNKANGQDNFITDILPLGGSDREHINGRSANSSLEIVLLKTRCEYSVSAANEYLRAHPIRIWFTTPNFSTASSFYYYLNCVKTGYYLNIGTTQALPQLSTGDALSFGTGKYSIDGSTGTVSLSGDIFSIEDGATVSSSGNLSTKGLVDLQSRFDEKVSKDGWNEVLPVNTTFFDGVNYFNLSKTTVYNDRFVNNNGTITSESNVTTIVFPVKPNTTYWFFATGMNRFFAVESAFDYFDIGSTYTVLHNSSESAPTRITTGNNAKYVCAYIANYVYDFTQNDVILNENQYNGTNNPYILPEYLPESVVNPPRPIIEPKDTTFFDGINYFNPDNVTLYTDRYVDLTGKIVAQTEVSTLAIPTSANTEYYLTIPNANRGVIAESENDDFTTGTQKTILVPNNQTQPWHFTTGANAEYIIVYFYSGTYDYEANKDSIILNKGQYYGDIEPFIPSKYISPNALTPLENTQVLIFGDSITDTCNFTINAQDQTTAVTWNNPSNSYTPIGGTTIYYSMWPKILRDSQGFAEIRNYARQGASYKTSERTSGEERQNLQYQITVALNDRNNPNDAFEIDNFVPDIVIFALGTNDGTPNDTFESAMNKTVLKSDGYSIDVSATLAALDDTKFCESARKAFLRIKQAFPLAQIYCVLPIQRANNDVNWGTLHQYLSEMATRYGCVIIDGTGESGITREFNDWNAVGEYLKDGLHPNDKGQNLMARMILASLKSHYVPFGTGFNPMN